MGGISIWQLLIILAIVLLIFGTKKFRSMGGDLGSAVKGFKNAMADGEKEPEKKTEEPKLDNKMDSSVIDVEVNKKEDIKKETNS